MVRSNKPVPVQDLLNAVYSTEGDYIKIVPVTTAGDSIISSSGGGVKITPVDTDGNYYKQPSSGEIVSSSASRTADFNSTDLSGNHRGAYVFLDINSADSSADVQLQVEGKSPGGTYFDLLTGSSFVPSTGASVKPYLVYPSGSTKVDGELSGISSAPLPGTWRVTVGHGTTKAVDYSIEAIRLP